LKSCFLPEWIGAAFLVPQPQVAGNKPQEDGRQRSGTEAGGNLPLLLYIFLRNKS
jgi:hypothetical protein